MSLESKHEALETLAVRRIVGHEQISQPYEFVIDAVSTRSPSPAADFVGRELSIVFARDGVELRRVHGIVIQAEEDFDLTREQGAYRLRLAPRVHRLARVRMQDISLGLSVPEIIEAKLHLVGLDAASRFSFLTAYPKREFVVQWDESDLAFVRRLTEHLGISFFFEQKEGGDTIVFTDHGDGFPKTPGLDGPVPFAARVDAPGLQSLRASTGMALNTYVVMDYNYRTPNVPLDCMHEREDGVGGIIEYGAHFKTPAEGDYLARVRVEEAEAQRVVYEGTSDVCQLLPGHRVVFDGHARVDGLELLVTEVDHEAAQTIELHSGGDGPDYKNRFRAVPVLAKSTFRPARVTPRPKIHGLITGIVQANGEGAVERYAKIDDQGRYVIQFLFDTTTHGEQKASHPVRKAEPTVGPDYGMHFPLRPGVEVVMAFVNGDPDRPIIVGACHNATVAPHVRAANSQTNMIKTASGIKMRFKDD